MPANALNVIHKFIRQELFDVSQQLAVAAPQDAARINSRLDEIVELLHGHAEHEEAIFEPLLREADPARAERLSVDHERLHEELGRVREAARMLEDADGESAIAGLMQLYLDWNRFVSGYLAHLDDEERGLFEPIRSALPPIDLVAKSISSDEASVVTFREKLWGRVSPAERRAIEQAQAGLADQPGLES